MMVLATWSLISVPKKIIRSFKSRRVDIHGAFAAACIFDYIWNCVHSPSLPFFRIMPFLLIFRQENVPSTLYIFSPTAWPICSLTFGLRPN